MTIEFEKKLYINILANTKRFFDNEDDVITNYYDCWCYLNEIIDNISDNASNWLLNKLYEYRDYYQNKYLTFKVIDKEIEKYEKIIY